MQDSSVAGVRFAFSPPGHLGQASAAVSERGGGASDAPYRSLNVGRSTADAPNRVMDNEESVLRALGLPNRVARLRLEHAARIIRVDGPGMFGPADALLTECDDLTLWFTVADCYPVTLSAGSFRIHGHCGWRSVAAGLPESLVTALAEASALPAREHRAWIGPGIGACCYPVGPEVAARFELASLVTGPDGTRRLDLAGDIRRRLVAAGLPESAVAMDCACTSCEADRFFSHRRDGAPTGRMAALCWSRAAGSSARELRERGSLRAQHE